MIHSLGFEEGPGGVRGDLYVQFQKNGEPTRLGYYKDVPVALYEAFKVATSPGQFLGSQLIGPNRSKPFFEFQYVAQPDEDRGNLSSDVEPTKKEDVE